MNNDRRTLPLAALAAALNTEAGRHSPGTLIATDPSWKKFDTTARLTAQLVGRDLAAYIVKELVVR